MDYVCYTDAQIAAIRDQNTLSESLIPRDLIEGRGFPPEAAGIELWRDLLRLLAESEGSVAARAAQRKLDRFRREVPPVDPRTACPRVFISHRSMDAPYALALGRIAKQEGFDIWIDVLDPTLKYLITQPNSWQKAVATAMVVEMAILNCSHVLATMTDKTGQSRWVPYEFGRIKERCPYASNAASWFHPSFSGARFNGTVVDPEYLLLCEQCNGRAAVAKWFRKERRKWSRLGAGCRNPNRDWNYGDTIPLPEPADQKPNEHSALRIRPYTESDETKVIALWQQTGLLRPWNNPRLDIMRKLGVQSNWFLVGEAPDGEIIATVMAGYDGHRGSINYLAVAPELQGEGIGRAMMRYVEACLTEAGCPKINLLVREDNVKVVAFYEQIGYQRESLLNFGKRLIAD